MKWPCISAKYTERYAAWCSFSEEVKEMPAIEKPTIKIIGTIFKT
jgi:hypothetical protein